MPKTIFVAIYKGIGFAQTRAYAPDASDLYSWMDRMGYDESEFSVEEIDLVG